MEWFTSSELESLGDLPSSARRVRERAIRENWQSRPRQAQGGGREYHISSLPKETQRALKISQTKKQQAADKQTEQINGAELKGTLAAMKLEGDEKTQDIKRTLAFNNLSPKEQARVRARSEVLAAWEVFVADFEAVEAATREFVDAFNRDQLGLSESVKTFVPKVSRASLFRWKASYADNGPAGLACQYKSVKQSIMDAQPLLVAFAEGMLARMPHTSPANMLRAMEGEFDQQDVRLPSKRALTTWLSNWKVKNKRLFTAVANPDAFKNQYMVAGGDAAENIVRLNQLWEMDSSPADIMCTDGRFTLISCLDVYSRRAVMKVRKSSDSFGVVLTARQAMLEWGLDGQGEQKIRVDNGKDYASHYFQIVADSLGIDLVSTDPYAGEQKPFVERLFRTFSHGLVELLPGFIGHNVAERQAIEAQFSFADRLKRKAGSSKNIIETTLSSEDLQAFTDRWIDTFYMHDAHNGLNGKTPAEMVQNWMEPVRRIEDERALDLLLEPIPGQKGVRTVQKKGVKLDGGWYVAPEMGSRVGDQFMVRYDTADIGRIYLFELSGEFVCVAQNPSITGISREELARAMKKEQKKVAEEKAALRKKGRKINQGELIEKIFARKERLIAERNANVTPFPKPQLPHETGYLDGAAEALAAADAADQKGSGHVDEHGQPTQELAQGMNQVVTDRVKQRTDPAETPTDRFQRWIRQHERKLAGEALNEMDHKWQERFELTPEWQGLKLVYDEFGKMAFGLKEE
ncbi:Mu transposase C-terminal domain-containing protein [Endozoicomonas numazuensis]|uniref:Transposase n=1 Tax=Endozoicomonas numazuensis TaxID=1137799 RepID=A0A081NL76_9GAMM|nr:Mu transposase C-terminal domain-containing protein [Endozoicomonas numazuensis]KEQ19199.1 hypothetical protein GZ78_04175 [Endozoicomonas numazuensis]